MPNVLFFIPQKKTTTLATVGGINASQTNDIKLTDVTGIDITKPGIICLSWSDPIVETAYEYVTYTSIDGTNVLQGVTREAEGSTGRIHANGVTVAFVYSKSHINNLNTGFQVEHDDAGTHKAATVTTLKASGAEVTTGTSDVKIVTPKALTDAGVTVAALTPPVKASAAEVVTGTNDAKFVTPLSLAGRDGWQSAGETWTYASASTFTVSGDQTVKYRIGTKLKFTNSTLKYAVVMSSSYGAPNTTVTIAVNTDYVIANAAITSNYYSYEESPQGAPECYAVAAPTFDTTYIDNGSGGQPTSNVARYSIQGRTCTVHYHGSGVKAGANSVVLSFADTDVPLCNRTYYDTGREVVGAFTGYVSSPGKMGVMHHYTDNKYYAEVSANYADNDVLADVSFTMTYEI